MVMDQGLKKCWLSHKLVGKEDVEEVRNVSSDHASEREKMGIVKTLKLKINIGMIMRVRMEKMNKGR
jgi:hypothetical protein